MKRLTKFLILFLMFGCQLPCAEINKVADAGALPEDVLNLMPYEHEEAVSFLYSDDTVVNLDVVRETRKQYEYYRDECTNITYIYEVDMTAMATVDSSLILRAWVANLTAIDWYEVVVNDSRFRFPVSPNAYLDAEILDSVLVDETVYYNVCRMPRITATGEGAGTPLVDTVLYNTELGFLEILLSDGSRYRRAD